MLLQQVKHHSLQRQRDNIYYAGNKTKNQINNKYIVLLMSSWGKQIEQGMALYGPVYNISC